MDMRIGANIIDTDNMTADELSLLINELRKIRKRKELGEQFQNAMKAVLSDMADNGFCFIDRQLGFVIEAKDLELIDSQINLDE